MVDPLLPDAQTNKVSLRVVTMEFRAESSIACTYRFQTSFFHLSYPTDIFQLCLFGNQRDSKHTQYLKKLKCGLDTATLPCI